MTTKLPKVNTRKSKRRGRGFGSGRGGHTVGRGMKGQKSRGDLNILFEGVKVKKSQLKRLPLRRGKGRFKAKTKPIIVKLSLLNLFPAGAKVSLDSLVNKGIVRKDDAYKLGVKILGDGDIKKRLTVEVSTSKSAARKIEKAKGKVVSAKEEKKSKAEPESAGGVASKRKKATKKVK